MTAHWKLGVSESDASLKIHLANVALLLGKCDQLGFEVKVGDVYICVTSMVRGCCDPDISQGLGCSTSQGHRPPDPGRQFEALTPGVTTGHRSDPSFFLTAAGIFPCS